MINSVERLVEMLLSMKHNGNDLNHQLKTVQGKNIKTGRFGAEWDKELESLFSSILCSDYRVVLDLERLYLYCSPESYLAFDYALEGDSQTIYIDFNTVKHIEGLLEGDMIVPYYKDEAGYVRTSKDKSVFHCVYFIRKHPDVNNQEDGETATDTLGEAIAKLKEGKEKNGNHWSLSSFIERKLQEKHMSKTELSDETDIKYKTLISKFKMNTITGEELIRIAIAMDLDMNEAKHAYQDSMKEKTLSDNDDVAYIANLVRAGFTGGILPSWELSLPHKQLYPLTPSEQNIIAKEIERGERKGFLSGDYPRGWKLNYESNEGKESSEAPDERTIKDTH